MARTVNSNAVPLIDDRNAVYLCKILTHSRNIKLPGKV